MIAEKLGVVDACWTGLFHGRNPDLFRVDISAHTDIFCCATFYQEVNERRFSEPITSSFMEDLWPISSALLSNLLAMVGIPFIRIALLSPC